MQATALEPAGANRYWTALRKYLEPGPAHLAMYTAGRFHSVRKLAVGCLQLRGKFSSRLLPTDSQPSLEDLDIGEAVQQLKRDGYANGLKIRKEVLRELREFCEVSQCSANGKANKPFLRSEKSAAEELYGEKFSTGRYLNCSDTCSAIQKLARDKYIVGIARGYLGAEPNLVGARCWWSFAADSDKKRQAADGQSFHYDLDDYRAICFFFYLTDVDAESGPHVCVLQSHRKKPLRYLLSPFKSRTDEEIEKSYHRSQILSVEGHAGEGFAEDLFCYHKGSHPKSNDRLLLQLRFRLQDFGGVNRDE